LNGAYLTANFFRSFDQIFNFVFEGDLLTGLAHRSATPCTSIGFATDINLPAADQSDYVRCRLFHGVYPNPVSIIIDKFGTITTGLK